MKDTKRLTYKLISSDDFNFYYALNKNIEVMRYAYAKRLESPKEARFKFDNMLSNQVSNDAGKQFVAIDKNTENKIGIVDFDEIKNSEKGRGCEIGYFLLPQYWGKGYAAEMGIAMVDYLFGVYNIDQITASCHGENKASERTMVKIGLYKEGVNKNGRFKDGKFSDEIRYRLLIDEWRRDNV